MNSANGDAPTRQNIDATIASVPRLSTFVGAMKSPGILSSDRKLYAHKPIGVPR